MFVCFLNLFFWTKDDLKFLKIIFVSFQQQFLELKILISVKQCLFYHMIKIQLFEDNTQLGEGLAMLLNSVDNYRVEGTFKNLSNLEHEIKKHHPDIVLMDIGFPSGSGIDGLRRIKAINKHAKVIMLTGLSDEKVVFEALKAGADGYLLKKTSPSKLLEYITEAFEGGAPMTPSIARQVLQAFSFSFVNISVPGIENLTAREKDVLKLLVNGQSYKMVAAELAISIDTVRSHIKSIYDKLEVNSKSEAVAKAIRNNLV
jgi:DNA-binding NarL/FixJ family response regulator